MKILSILLACFVVPAFGQQKTTRVPDFTQPPGAVTILDGISTSLRERDFALSPDGSEVFYTLQAPIGGFQSIIYRKKTGNGWSDPEVASFSGRYTDLEPAFSPDGLKLYFCSNRPLSGDTPKDFDIWVLEKKDGSWQQPKNLGAPVNTAGNEFYPSVARNGNLYFTATYHEKTSKEDIFIAEWKEGKYQSPVALGDGVNSGTYEFNAFVAPDESYIIFTSYGRADDHGRGDLYISRKENGGWQPAVNMDVINSDKLDYCPFVSPDGKALFFTSERHAVNTRFPDAAATYAGLAAEYGGLLNGNGNVFWISLEAAIKK